MALWLGLSRDAVLYLTVNDETGDEMAWLQNVLIVNRLRIVRILRISDGSKFFF